MSNFNNTMTGNTISSFQPAYHISLVVLSIFITGHNILVLIVYAREKALHTTTNFLLCNLACCDLLTGCISIPILISANFAPSNRVLLFSVNVFADFTTVGIVLSLTSVTLERYINLCHPFQYPSIVTKTRLRCVVLCIWSMAAAVSIIPVTWSHRGFHSDTNFQKFTQAYQIHTLVVLILFFLIPTVLSLCALISMFCTVHRLTKSDIMATAATRRRRERRAVLIFFSMYNCLVICWTPMVVIRMLLDFELLPFGKLCPWMLELFVVLRNVPSFTNPMIYVWCKMDFRRAVVKIRAIEWINSFRNKNMHREATSLIDMKSNITQV